MNSRPPVVLPEPAEPGAPPRDGWFALIGWILLLVGLEATLGGLFAPDAWFSGLLKPTWNPPSKVFIPVLTTLYATMAAALWLVRREPESEDRLRNRAQVLFAIQLALTLAWKPLFFGLHSPGLAFADVCLLWIALLSTVLAFGRVRPLAGYLLLPYLLWVSFALVLNGTIWLMNS